MKTDVKQIDVLIDKFYDCETTREEEKYLKQYFHSDNVAPHHKILVPQFIFADNDSPSLSNSFDDKMMELLNQNTNKVLRLPNVFKSFWKYSAVAVVILGFGILYFMNSNPIEVTGNSSLSDDEFAYQETINALQLISGKLDKADDHFQTFELLNQGLEQLNQLNNFEKLKYLDKVIKKENK